MKRSVVSIMAVAAFAACFDDPTSSLRNGPAQLVLDRSAALVPYNDSLGIEVRVKDAQGNPQVVGPVTFTTGSAAVATVNPADVQDGEVVVRANILAHDPVGGVTFVRVTAQGLTDSIRVTSLPTAIPAGSAVIGGAVGPDTLGTGTAFTAGDTITITLPATMDFSVAAGEESGVNLGNQAAYILSQDADQIRAVSRGSYQGAVEITNVVLLANATLGTAAVNLDLQTADVVTVAKPRFRGTESVAGGIVLTIDAAAGQSFSTTAGALSAVKFGPDLATVITRTTAQIVVSSPLDYTGGYTITNVNGGGILLDSVKSVGNITIQRATFPGTIAITGDTSLLDTLTLTAGAGVTFGATSNIVTGGRNGFVLSRNATTIVAVPAAPGPVNVTSVTVGATTFPSLPEGTGFLVKFAVNESNEPANDNGPTGNPMAAPVNVGDTTTSFGAVEGPGAAFANPGPDFDDYFVFTPANAGTYRVIIDWGNGTIDIDGFVLNGAGGGFCVLDGCAGATGADPETMNVTLNGGTSYTILSEMWDNHAVATPTNYRVRIIRIS